MFVSEIRTTLETEMNKGDTRSSGALLWPQCVLSVHIFLSFWRARSRCCSGNGVFTLLPLTPIHTVTVIWIEGQAEQSSWWFVLFFSYNVLATFQFYPLIEMILESLQFCLFLTLYLIIREKSSYTYYYGKKVHSGIDQSALPIS